MALIEPDESLQVPERSVLFYVGAPKTGTTTVQEAAAKARATLAEHGVLYPGKAVSQRRPVYAFMGKRIQRAKAMARGAKRSSAVETPDISEWKDLMTEVAAHGDDRIFISCEEAARCTDAQAEKFVQELGAGRTHIAITLRSMGSMLPSQWTELLKSGQSTPFETWLRQVFDDEDRSIPATMRLYFDSAGLVERWARAAGPENVTVIISDTRAPNLLTDSFEKMLGLPHETLTGVITGGARTNRSMSRLEAEVFRQVNEEIYDPNKLSWPLYLDVVQSGAIRHVLANRTLEESEDRVRLPKWAADLAVAKGRDHAERIEAAGVRIVGDLGNLSAAPTSLAEGEEWTAPPEQSIAVRALVGAINGAARAEESALRQASAASGEAERARELSAKLETITSERNEARAEASSARAETVYERTRRLPHERRIRVVATSFTSRDLVRALAMRLSLRIVMGRSLRLK